MYKPRYSIVDDLESFHIPLDIDDHILHKDNEDDPDSRRFHICRAQSTRSLALVETVLNSQ